MPHLQKLDNEAWTLLRDLVNDGHLYFGSERQGDDELDDDDLGEDGEDPADADALDLSGYSQQEIQAALEAVRNGEVSDLEVDDADGASYDGRGGGSDEDEYTDSEVPEHFEKPSRKERAYESLMAGS